MPAGVNEPERWAGAAQPRTHEEQGVRGTQSLGQG
jgi:hypothetical protein